MFKLRNLYLETRFYVVLTAIALVFIPGVRWDVFILIGQILISVFFVLVFLDIFLLMIPKQKVEGKRNVNEKFSLGDENPVVVQLSNKGDVSYYVVLIEELPYQFQIRNFRKAVFLRAGENISFSYELRPVQRGEYSFGNLNLFLKTFLKLASFRIIIEQETIVKVYPSIAQMKNHELIILSQNATLQGIKKIRKLGANNEFEQIKNYVQGDDYRSINWKATSRRNELMVNQYQEERSQNMYCVIDKSRSMRLPFNEMSLLDYAINSSLVMSNTAMMKGDKAGLYTFSDKLGTRIAADNGVGQMKRILEALYKQKTKFHEANFELLYTGVRHQIKGRSLLLLYTNFESVYALERALPVLRKINQMHLLVVVFFENSELDKAQEMQCDTVRDVYFKTLAQKFLMEKELITRELAKYGIQSILSKPEDLTVNSINKYLELKSRGMI